MLLGKRKKRDLIRGLFLFVNPKIFHIPYEINKEGRFCMEKVVYTVLEIQELLGCCRSKAYELVENAYLNKDAFRVIKVGKSYMVPKESFHNWLING